LAPLKPIVLLLLFCLFTHIVAGQIASSQRKSADTAKPKFDSLKPATVIAAMRPHVKGDTVEYNTGAIHLRPYANVDELLTRLPGLQIAPDGTITFNGQNIKRLLVDGEDVFGGNPTLITRNFDASKIEKIQLLDRKSEQSLFSGADDGTRTKTMNLVIKNSEKNGYFGKIEAGGNPAGYYTDDGFTAALKDKQQLVIFGLAGNTGATNFASNPVPGLGSLSYEGGTSDPLGASAGIGIPTFAGTAVHYTNSWNGTRQHLSASYQYAHYSTEPITTTQTAQTLADTVYGQNQQARSKNRDDQQKIDGTFDWSLNQNSAFKLIFSGSSGEGSNQLSATSTGSFNEIMANNVRRSIDDLVTYHAFRADLYWRQQIAKQGRNITFGVGLNQTSSSTNGYIYSLSSFYRANGTLQGRDTVDQRKQITDAPLNLKAFITYTEPLWKGASLQLNSSTNITTDNSLQASYSKGDGKYTNLLDSLSIHYESQTHTQKGELSLEGRTKKLYYNVGTDWFVFHYRQKDFAGAPEIQQSYFNLSPHGRLAYYINPTNTIRLLYNTSIQPPSISQLQPAKNNSDPLYITLGNPGLKPTLTQAFRLDYEQVRDWMLFFDFGYDISNNSISTRIHTDSLGRQVSQNTNTNGNKMATLVFGFRKQVAGLNVDLHTRASSSTTYNYINADLNKNTTYSGTEAISVQKSVTEKYSFKLSSDFVYFAQSSNINSSIPYRYWTQNHSTEIVIYLGSDYMVKSNAIYTWQQRATELMPSTSTFLWDASAGKDLFRHRLTVRIELHNILDRNIGISRTNINNTNTSTSTNVLGRNWMLSATLHFDKKWSRK